MGCVNSVANDIKISVREVLKIDVVDFDTEVNSGFWMWSLERADFEGFDWHCV